MTAKAWLRPRRMTLALLVLFLSLFRGMVSAARPGGNDGVRLTKQGLVEKEGGVTIEERELRQSEPNLAHFVSIGSAAHKSLKKSGYAYGPLVGIRHSDRDKEFGEGPERTGWFPMVLVLSVVEDAIEDGADETEVQYEVVLDFDPKRFAAPGFALLEAMKLAADGGIAAKLEMPPPVGTSFLEKNRPGITTMFGVIIASGLVKFLRRGMEMLLRRRKTSGTDGDGEEGKDAAASGGSTDVTSSVDTSTPKKSTKSKKRGGGSATKQD